jgi:hypothetical protein
MHHDELLNMDAVLNEHSNKIQMLSNRLDKGSGALGGISNVSDNSNKTSERDDFSYDKLVNDTAFITKILDNILTNTNLSDIINQIEPLQKENESLRTLLNSQQTTLNELSGLVMKLIASGLPSYGDGGGGGGEKEYNYSNYDNANIVESSVYTPQQGQYSEQDMTESNYVCDPVSGPVGGGPEGVGGICSLSIGSLEEVVDEDMNGEEDEEEEQEEEEGAEHIGEEQEGCEVES